MSTLCDNHDHDKPHHEINPGSDRYSILLSTTTVLQLEIPTVAKTQVICLIWPISVPFFTPPIVPASLDTLEAFSFRLEACSLGGLGLHGPHHTLVTTFLVIVTFPAVQP